jgi:cysteine desulfurase/selenocysteine lyase
MPANLSSCAPRDDFPILSRRIHGKELVYLDAAATAQKPRVVIEAMTAYLEQHTANVHRGVHTLAEESTTLYESSRMQVASFLHGHPDEIIFTKGATEGLNVLMRTWGVKHLQPGDEVIVSIAEHHANFVPWQILCQEKKAKFIVLPLLSTGSIDLVRLKKALTSRTKIIALTHMSNVLGSEQPIAAVSQIIHATFSKKRPLFVVDAAQSVAHIPINVRDFGGDALVFSGHKLYGPPGIGVLWVAREILEDLPPFLYGGDMIKKVTVHKTTFADIPSRFEAGTPNVVGAVGLAAAITYMHTLGMTHVHEHGLALGRLAFDELSHISGVKLISPRDNNGIVSFVVPGIHPHDVATLLDEDGIAIRAGHHCAEPLHTTLGFSATCRASFSIFNTSQDVHQLVKGIHHVQEVFHA